MPTVLTTVRCGQSFRAVRYEFSKLKTAIARLPPDTTAATVAVIASTPAPVLLEVDILGLMRNAGIRKAGFERRNTADPTRPESPLLTARELDVLRLLVNGDSNGQIAIRLGISTKTASVHVSNILHRLGATNRVQAAVRASALGLFPAPMATAVGQGR